MRERGGSVGERPHANTSPGSSLATSGADADLIRQRYEGLRPFAPAPPAPPAVKPITLSASDPTVFSHVPMTDKVVFVTIDDGIEKEPQFIQMVKDFQIPITISLADVLIRDDYAYFEKLYETGYISIQNHTVTHTLDMPSLPASRQLDEISGQQEKLHKEYGVTPYIFRPPGGNYDATTIASASEAGLLILPMAAAIGLTARLSGRLVAAGRARWALVIAGVAITAGSAALTTVRATTPIAELVLVYIVFGIGFGFVNPPISNTAVSGMPPAQSGVAASIASTCRQVGATLGVAVIGSMVAGHELAGFTAASHGGWAVVCGCGLAVLLLGVASTSGWARATALRTRELLIAEPEEGAVYGRDSADVS